MKELFGLRGLELGLDKAVSFSMPSDSASSIFQGTLTFKSPANPEVECVKAHMVGTRQGEIKLIVDINEELLSQQQISDFQDDIGFFMGSYEISP